jgi:integrase
MPGMKARTKNTALTEMKILSIVMKEAVLRGLAPANPLYQLGIQRTPVKRKPAITSEEQARVEGELSKEWVPQWMRDQWLVAMKHGCRLREVQVPLTPDRLNLERMAITFQGKKGKLHTMPLHEDCVGLVKRRLAEHARVLVELAPSPSKWWRKLLDRAGCPHFSFHSTRVSVITRLALAGIPEPVTRAFVGHASQTVHQIYQQFRVEEVRQVGRVL